MTDTSDTTPQHAALLSDREIKAVARAKLEDEMFTLNKGALLDALALAGVTRVVVSFDGYGDSGQIENVEVQAGDDQVAMPGAAIEFSEAIWDQTEQGVRPPVSPPSSRAWPTMFSKRPIAAGRTATVLTATSSSMSRRDDHARLQRALHRVRKLHPRLLRRRSWDTAITTLSRR